MICFSTLGFPQYGARCARAFVRSTKERVAVVATRPDVPVKGMEELAECEVHWVRLNDNVSLKELLGEVPRVLTVPGWKFELFNRFRDEVHANGGKVIAGADNNFLPTFKTFLKMLQFRLLYKNKYDGFWVPKKSGYKLMRFYGVPDEKIFTDSYSADASLFVNGPSLVERRKRILYVGRFIPLKNVHRLCSAFLSVDSNIRDGWSLELYGCGPLKNSYPKDKSIVIHDFVQPEQLASVYQSARVFVLPSEWDHWGFVLHEAALSGCVILASRRCGASLDFIENGVNGYVFSPFSTSQMKKALVNVMTMDDEQLARAQQKSLELAHQVSLQAFVDSVKKFSAC